ncbi:hypothetical protein WJX73_003900 [Symbiochloris irregularis]|uniref:Uncharacterized protein n=1 Tax=Symbiochloris irregularis TaxID=706552 RepID=A0AAW1PHD3_9CHLO
MEAIAAWQAGKTEQARRLLGSAEPSEPAAVTINRALAALPTDAAATATDLHRLQESLTDLQTAILRRAEAAASLRAHQDDSGTPPPALHPVHELSILQLNQAVVLSHLRQYDAATTLLQQLRGNADALPHGVDQRSLFLLADCYMATNQYSRAHGGFEGWGQRPTTQGVSTRDAGFQAQVLRLLWRRDLPALSPGYAWQSPLLLWHRAIRHLITPGHL